MPHLEDLRGFDVGVANTAGRARRLGELMDGAKLQFELGELGEPPSC